MPCRSRRNSSCCNIAKNERTNGFFHITSGAMASFLPAGLVQMKLFGECHRWSVAPNPCQNDRPNGQRHIGAEQGVSIISSMGWKRATAYPSWSSTPWVNGSSLLRTSKTNNPTPTLVAAMPVKMVISPRDCDHSPSKPANLLPNPVMAK